MNKKSAQLKYIMFLIFIFAAAFFSTHSPASAQVSFFTDETSFVNANSGLAFQDFSAAAVPPVVGKQCSGSNNILNENTDNVCFSPGDILPGIEFVYLPESIINNNWFVSGENFQGFNNNPPNVIGPTQAGDDRVIETSFSVETTAVGLNLPCTVNTPPGPCNQTTQVMVFDTDDNPIGSTTIDTNGPSGPFLGIVSDTNIQIGKVVTTILEQPVDDAAFPNIENVRFGIGGATTDITLAPLSSTAEVPSTHTVTATVETNEAPDEVSASALTPGVLIKFEVTSGPNTGEVSDPGTGECNPDNCETDQNGQVSWTYEGLEAGTDIIVASFDDRIFGMKESNTVEQIWTNPPLLLGPIFPGVASNLNSIEVGQASPNGNVAFLWGFMPGSTIIGGPTCNGTELGMNDPRLLGIIQAGADQTATFFVHIPLNPAFQNPVLVQAIDIATCRTSEVVTNIIISN